MRLRMMICLAAAMGVMACAGPKEESVWIRINQLGYAPGDFKVAVLGRKKPLKVRSFELVDARSGKTVFKADYPTERGNYGPFAQTWRLDFSSFQDTGRFYLKTKGIHSPEFRINSDVYDGIADFLLKYMRQQRCGYNPFLKDSCHVHDGYTVYAPVPDGTLIDVVGGWHDAADYLQYVSTSANATYNLLFAWRENPRAFGDAFDANGDPGANGIPDVLDEAKWGLNWLLKMHPKEDWLFNQIADDRDHAGFRLPNEDSVVYDFPGGRPVYFCTGEPQGLLTYKNRATGVASAAGKFASAFALGEQIWKGMDPEYSQLLGDKARSAYALGQAKPGACQTAPGGAPYFYEEDNWNDDMELAAMELYNSFNKTSYSEDAGQFADGESVTPWMGTDTARHYQWHPFFNIGHFALGVSDQPELKTKAIQYYKDGIDKVLTRANDNAFRMGVPFIWCSNNLVASFATQLNLYRRMSGDTGYQYAEAAMRDWLLGCNPWGTSMIIGLPAAGEKPDDPHSSLSRLYRYPIDGGLVDGPVYTSIFKQLKGLRLFDEDEMAPFQSGLAVYHDDAGDYSTNEPTMDGTAILMYLFARMQTEARLQDPDSSFTVVKGAVIRGDQNKKTIALVFTGDEYANGGEIILNTLTKHGIHGSFFLTGKFYRNPAFSSLLKSLKNNGHYLGGHSDQHLLYCDWLKRDSLLVNRKTFITDLLNNYQAMNPLGVSIQDAPYFLPPYEWYNDTIAEWTGELGLTLIDYTPGAISHADYTLPSEKNYRASQAIYENILSYESEQSQSLNGFILLSHIGAHPERTDHFFDHLDALLTELEQRGYTFVRIDELLGD